MHTVSTEICFQRDDKAHHLKLENDTVILISISVENSSQEDGLAKVNNE